MLNACLFAQQEVINVFDMHNNEEA